MFIKQFVSNFLRSQLLAVLLEEAGLLPLSSPDNLRHQRQVRLFCKAIERLPPMFFLGFQNRLFMGFP